MDRELSWLDEVVAVLRRRWLLLLIVAVPLFGGVLGTARALPTTWTTTATVAFSPRPDNPVGADTVSLVLPSYVSYVLSSAVSADVGGRVGLTAEQLRSDTNVAIPPATATMDVVVTGSSPTRVAEAANGLARAAVDRSGQDAVVSAALVAPAVAPAEPSGPRRLLLAVVGLVAALLLGAVVVALVERGVPRVRTSADVRGALGVEVLGRLPWSRALRGLGTAGLADPAVGLAVRTLRTRLGFDSEAAPRVLAVTSPTSGEGATTVVALLGSALARLDVRVLLVDVDFGERRLSRELSAQGIEADLVDVLQGAPLREAVLETSVVGLHLLPLRNRSHKEVAEAGELLARRVGVLLERVRVARLHRRPVPVPSRGAGTFEHLPESEEPLSGWEDDEGRYDVVLLDVGALLERDETTQLGRLADEVLLVAGAGRATRRLREAGTLLASVGTAPLGVVLNGAPRKSVLADDR